MCLSLFTSNTHVNPVAVAARIWVSCPVSVSASCCVIHLVPFLMGSRFYLVERPETCVLLSAYQSGGFAFIYGVIIIILVP